MIGTPVPGLAAAFEFLWLNVRTGHEEVAFDAAKRQDGH
jgi:hypothetical protein